MRSTYKQVTSVTLRLDGKETEWLRGIMQDSLMCNQCSADAGESEEDKDMREKFFKALTPTLTHKADENDDIF